MRSDRECIEFPQRVRIPDYRAISADVEVTAVVALTVLVTLGLIIEVIG